MSPPLRFVALPIKCQALIPVSQTSAPSQSLLPNNRSAIRLLGTTHCDLFA
jgi:hypothetical protein